MNKDVNIPNTLSKKAKRKANATAKPKPEASRSGEAEVRADTIVENADTMEKEFMNVDSEDSISTSISPTGELPDTMDVFTDRITTTDRKNVSTTPDEEMVELPASEGSARERAGVDEFCFADESKSLANKPISIPKDVARTMKDISESSTMTGSIRYAVNEESYPKHDEQVLTFESSGFSIRLPYSIKEHKEN